MTGKLLLILLVFCSYLRFAQADNGSLLNLPSQAMHPVSQLVDSTQTDSLHYQPGENNEAVTVSLPFGPGAAVTDSTATDSLQMLKPRVPPPPLDSLLLFMRPTDLQPLDTLLMFHAAANWFDLAPWLGSVQTVGAGYTGHTLFLASGGLPPFLLPITRDGVVLNNPATGLYNLNQLGFSRSARVATADGLALVTAQPSPDTVLSDLDYRQAFYGNNRVLFRTQHPLPGGLFLGETRQQFFSGKMLNGEARDNCTSLALYRYLFWRSWLVAEFNLDRHYNGVWQSPLSTLQRETHQQFSLKLPGVADSWRWRPAFRYRRDHLYQESPYNQGLESWSWFGSLLLEKSFSPDDRLQMLTELDATAIEGESYRLNRRLGRGRLQVALAPLERLRLQSGLELLYEDERDRWLRSGWLQGALKLSAQLEWRIELASRQDFLPFSWQRGGAEVLQQYREAYPLLRADAVTDFLPDPAAISCSRRGGSTTVSYRHTAGHSVALTGWSWAFRDFPYLYATVDSAATVGQQPTTLYGEELRLDLQLPRQLHWLTLQSWQRDSKGVVNPELPTLRFASELRWDGHFYEGALHFNLACGATSTWGAIRTDGEPLSDQVIPYLHLVARQGNFTLYWSFQNPLSFEHYSMEGIPGMHRDEIIGIMWRLVN